MGQKSIIAILGVVVIVLIGTTIYFAMSKNVNQPAATTSNVVQQPVPTPVAQKPTPTPVAQQTNQPTNKTAGWQTYKNEQYGFEFKYPKEWNIVDTTKGAGYAAFEISLYPNYDIKEPFEEAPPLLQIFQSRETLDEYFRKTDSSNKQPYILSGLSGYIISNPILSGPIYAFSKNGKAFVINIYLKESNNLNVGIKEAMEILSTFKFTN